jgi:hypothetical protein
MPPRFGCAPAVLLGRFHKRKMPPAASSSARTTRARHSEGRILARRIPLRIYVVIPTESAHQLYGGRTTRDLLYLQPLLIRKALHSKNLAGALHADGRGCTLSVGRKSKWESRFIEMIMKFELEEYHRGITDEELIADLKSVANGLNKNFVSTIHETRQIR